MKLDKVRRFRKQLGQGMTEYIIIVALIAVSAIAVYAFFGQTVRHQTAGLANELAGKDAATNISNAGTSADSATAQGTQQRGMGSYNAGTALSTGGGK
ncbi:Flp family type IVb pilin [Burkholderia cenocepacia]|uniref:Flp family type IVb pilin n=1 Tax=Burkholderia cenocepacia TaxID=95486 RepID=UPI0026557EA5|nr:pilus assembly protein [Burkholderia cenocepacia]MDN7452314.1 pilus assembly protein [Burkholderia cenocepacia]